MKARFVKLSDRWYIDIPWSGSIGDLEMVAGADTLLDVLSAGNKEFNCTIETEPIDGKLLVELHKTKCNNQGGTYTSSIVERIWLCNVTKHLFKIFPKTFYIYE